MREELPLHDEARAKEGTYQEDRASFMKRLVLKITPGEREKLDFAYDLAKYGHRNQFRETGARYFEHVRAAALILIDELGITDVEMIIAALLHDMLEDSFLLTPGRIHVTLGDRVMMMASVVTKPKKGDPRFATDAERHQWYFAQVAKASVDAKIIKLADRLHNMRTLGSCSLEKIKRKVEETKLVYFPLIADVYQEHPGIAEYIRSGMDEAIARLEAA